MTLSHLVSKCSGVMRIYKNAWFAKFARKEKIDDDALCDAIRRAEKGMIDADLGSGLLKQRVAREGAGKSSGYRTLIFFRSGERAIFVAGFAKNDKANLNALELAELRKAAKMVLAFSQDRIENEVKAGRLAEVEHGNENL
jgi:hypothetical protein